MEPQAPQSANPPAERTSPATFRQRAVERLQAERAADLPPSPAESPIEDGQVTPDVAPPAGQVEALPPESEAPPVTADLEPTDGQPEGAAGVEETQATDVASEPEEGSVEFYRVQAEKAEEARANMERDYRLKTTDIAEARRESEALVNVARAENEFYVGQAERLINEQFGQVNWEMLKADPAEYQKAASAYQNALNQRDALIKRREQLRRNWDKQVEAEEQRQANLSKSILKTTLGSAWSNDHVLKLREFAENEGLYKGAAFDRIVDWQPMLMLHNMYVMKNAQTKLQPARKVQGNKPPAQGKATKDQPRNAAGQFEKARTALRTNPGDRGARREYFKAKLAAERGGR